MAEIEIDGEKFTDILKVGRDEYGIFILGDQEDGIFIKISFEEAVRLFQELNTNIAATINDLQNTLALINTSN